MFCHIKAHKLMLGKLVSLQRRLLLGTLAAEGMCTAPLSIFQLSDDTLERKMMLHIDMESVIMAMIIPFGIPTDYVNSLNGHNQLNVGSCQFARPCPTCTLCIYSVTSSA